jgi:hypothetical protein
MRGGAGHHPLHTARLRLSALAIAHAFDDREKKRQRCGVCRRGDRLMQDVRVVRESLLGRLRQLHERVHTRRLLGRLSAVGGDEFAHRAAGIIGKRFQ